MRLSKTLRTGAVVAAAGLALAACGGSGGSGSGSGSSGSGGDSGSGYIEVVKNPQFEQGTKMAEIAKSGKVTIGTKFKQPLFGFKKLSGELVGFDVEIAKIIAAKLGIKPEQINWKRTPSKFRELYIEQGKVDFVVATYTINDDRKKRVSFVGPYYQAGQTLMVRKENSKIKGPESLKKTGAQVCTARGSTSYQNIKEYVPKSQITLFDSYSKCADALGTKQVDAVTTDNVILMGLVSESKGKFKLAGKPFTEEPYGIGIPQEHDPFCKFISKTLKQSAKSGAYTKAWEKTAGKFAKDTPELPELNSCT